ncbi:MAG: hypothetical protein ACK4NP_03610 [Parvularculaceae bacterium]
MLSDHCRDFTREQLYALVWETPISRLAKSFGLSNVGLRKICERHNIPTTPLGYWAKLAHGKKVRRPALVAEEDGRSVSIRIYGRGWAVVTPEVEKDQVAAITASQLHPSIVVADNRPPRLHAITAATARALRAAKMDREGFMKASPNDGVCLTVSDSSLDRALRIIDAFARAAELRGHGFEEHAGGMRIVVEKVHFEWRMHEIKDKEEHEPTASELTAQTKLEAQQARWGQAYSRPPKAYRTWDYSPSGHLSIAFKDKTLPSWRHEALIGLWRDRKVGRLEDYLDDAMNKLAAAAVATRHRLAEVAEKRRLEDEERETRRQLEARRDRQRKRRDFLINMADEYARYRRLKEFAVHLKQEIGIARDQPTDRLFEELGLLLRTMETEFLREAIENAVTRLGLFAGDDLRELPGAVDAD